MQPCCLNALQMQPCSLTALQARPCQAMLCCQTSILTEFVLDKIPAVATYHDIKSLHLQLRPLLELQQLQDAVEEAYVGGGKPWWLTLVGWEDGERQV